MSDTQAFVFRLDHRLPAAIQSNTIGLGWSKARDMDKHKDWDTFKEILRAAYPDYYANSERALGNAAGSLWRFIFAMNNGDYVVLPTTDSAFHLAVIDGDAFHDENGMATDFAWKRPVKWLTKTPIPRNFTNNDLQKRMKARQTCVDATGLLNEIVAVQNRKKPLTFNDTILQDAYEAVAKALQSAVTDRGLEEVVKNLAAASGAQSTVLAKNSGKDGDADVLATYDLRIGKQDAKVKVAYQIKQHKDVSDHYGIKQLLDRMECAPDDIDKGCFVTTAKEITKEADELARANDIIVLKEKELVEWILMTGLNAITV